MTNIVGVMHMLRARPATQAPAKDGADMAAEASFSGGQRCWLTCQSHASRQARPKYAAFRTVRYRATRTAQCWCASCTPGARHAVESSMPAGRQIAPLSSSYSWYWIARELVTAAQSRHFDPNSQPETKHQDVHEARAESRCCHARNGCKWRPQTDGSHVQSVNLRLSAAVGLPKVCIQEPLAGLPNAPFFQTEEFRTCDSMTTARASATYSNAFCSKASSVDTSTSIKLSRARLLSSAKENWSEVSRS